MYNEPRFATQKLIEKYMAPRTLRRKALSPLITSSISNMIEKIEMEKLLPRSLPRNYRKSNVMQLENIVTRLPDEDRNDYENKMFGSRHTDLPHKHFKKLNKSSIFPFTTINGSATESTSIGKAKLFSRFSNSISSSKKIKKKLLGR